MAKRTASPSEIRTWAVENGQPVGARGRLSADLTDAYYKAQAEARKAARAAKG